jgi:septum formation protein
VLVLASASPRRRALLREAGIEHVALPVEVDETPPPDETPEAVAMEIARRKTLAAAARTPDRPVVGADTIVVLDGRLLGKPASPADAVATLRPLSGRRHRVITGLSVLIDDHAGPVDRAVTTEVVFREIPDVEIEEYVAGGEPLDKAGAYGIQGEGGKFVVEVRGSRSNVIGLPIATLREVLRR